MTRIGTADLPGLIRLAIAADTPLFVIGPAGIGKSKIFAKVATELGILLIVLDLSVLEPTDLIGIPQITNGRTTYATPDLFPTGGQGILLLEELNRAPIYTRTPALELLTSRTIHGYRLPPGWLPVAAANPDGADYAVDSLDPAFMSRFIVVELSASVTDWVSWARVNGIHPAVLNYVEAVPDFFEKTKVCPRALEQASKILFASAGPNPPEIPIVTAALAGVLGDPIAIALLRFSKDSVRPFEPSDIVDHYPRVQPDVRRLRQSGRLDLIRAITTKLEAYLDAARWAAVAKDRNKKRNLGAFLGDVPPDMRGDFYRRLAAKGLIPAIEP